MNQIMNKGSCKDLLELHKWPHHTYMHLQSNTWCLCNIFGQNMQYNMYMHFSQAWFFI